MPGFKYVWLEPIPLVKLTVMLVPLILTTTLPVNELTAVTLIITGSSVLTSPILMLNSGLIRFALTIMLTFSVTEL